MRNPKLVRSLLAAAWVAVALASAWPGAIAAQMGPHAELIGAGVKEICLKVHMAQGLDRLAKARGVSFDSMAVTVLRNFKGQGVPMEQIRSMLCGEVTPGMPSPMAIAAWDRPERQVRQETEDGSAMLWIYGDGRRIVILDGVVYSVTEAEGS